jgi:DNA-binding GntR family transcriptional regulator
MSGPLTQRAYEEIKKRILLSDLKPGERLSDKQIAQELAVGRTPVREALLILQREKIVQCNGKRGYFVRKLTREEAEGYFSIRTALELFAAPAMLKGATPFVLRSLEENISKSERYGNKGNITAVANFNNEFHKILYTAVNSHVFLEIILSLNERLHWLRAIALRAPGGHLESLNEHKKILKALKDKNVRELKKAIKLHLCHARLKYISISKIIF